MTPPGCTLPAFKPLGRRRTPGRCRSTRTPARSPASTVPSQPSWAPGRRREPVPLGWDDPITENPALNAIEVWEMYNFTEDAHPIHIHEVQFQVVNRQPFDGDARPPEPGRRASRTPSSPTRARSPGSRPCSTCPALRLALPHRRARGQRDDAAVPHRSDTDGFDRVGIRPGSRLTSNRLPHALDRVARDRRRRASNPGPRTTQRA